MGGAINRLSASPAAPRVSPVPAAATADGRERPTGRSMIPLAPQRSLPGSFRPVGTSSAPFLAQLIATKQKAPQTRERRRADPGDASAAYGAILQASAGTVSGRVVTRIA